MPNATGRLADYHVHSNHSIDGESSIDEICNRAIELRMAEIGFCEHVEMDPDDPWYSFLDYDRYSEALDIARSQYEGELIIRKGVEIGYNRTYERQISEWLEGKHFDFLVGSVHTVDHNPFDLDGKLGMPPDTAVQRYYVHVKDAVESKLFDVIGHFDLIRDYLPPQIDPVSPVSDIIDTIFERMIANQTHLEINSRRKTDREPFPFRRLIQRYLNKGGERFSFGSDAHSAEHVAIGISQATDLLHSLGPKTIHALF